MSEQATMMPKQGDVMITPHRGRFRVSRDGKVVGYTHTEQDAEVLACIQRGVHRVWSIDPMTTALVAVVCPSN